MNDWQKGCDVIRELGPWRRGYPSFTPTKRDELTHELQKYIHTLGVAPKRCLETFVDLGMTNAEIARYFEIPDDVVGQLRAIWEIEDAP